ncbi:MAG: glucans biosynthesis glucosyltransferase MdoH [Proteobacteria bacterium]|nr:glucans biosynthesis glucosyltransferase MdoH [Pseudomonadota bacterium]
MDAVAQSRAPAPQAAPRERPPFLPREAPIDMPGQPLHGTGRPPSPDAMRPRGLALRRAFIVLATFAMTAFAADQMYLVLSVSSLTLLETAILVLFVILFAWIAFSFANAAVGFVLTLSGYDRTLDIDPRKPLPELRHRHALLVPTYNEEPGRLFARLQATYESIVETGRHDSFDVFVLSDTTDPATWLNEEKQYLALIARTGSKRLFYRHRRDNVARKAGNISDWVTRFGGHYDSMVILDADSLMTGDAVVRLAAAIEQHPDVALVQTLPIIVNGGTIFARLQQFAGRLYGPMLARGIAWWFGTESNYWGHNAAIRVKAFAAHAGLPELSGRRPLGGHILSHDFVEAALMRRAGWAIMMAPSLRGSYEETPPSITEFAARDRRWCQGNLQHMKILPARGLHFISRLHFLIGIGAYITAPLWFIFLIIGILISLQAHFIRPEYFAKGFTLFPVWPEEDPIRAAYVFGATMAMLISPKFLALIAALFNGSERRGFGGGFRMIASTLVEIFLSALIAPSMMVFQSQAVASVLLGHDSGWNVQRRDDGSLPFAELMRRYGPLTLVGLILAAAAYAVSFSLFLWMTPVTIGLSLAMPLAALTARRGFNVLLVAPEGRTPPAVLTRANELGNELVADDTTLDGALHDADLAQAHLSQLAPPLPHAPGQIDKDLVIARAKLAEFDSLDQALTLLSAREKRSVLSDPEGFRELAALARP